MAATYSRPETDPVAEADLATHAGKSVSLAHGTVKNADVDAAAAIAESKLSLASDAAAGTASRRTLGTAATQAAAGNDGRLSDARTPLAHTHPESDVVGLGADLAARELTANKAAAGGYPSLDGSSRVVQNPKLHKADHEPGGSDALTLLDNSSVKANAGIGASKLAIPNTTPGDQGLLAWTFDPVAANFNFALNAGVAWYSRLKVPEAITVTNVLVHVSVPGTGATALANCFVALYNQSGTRLGVSANQASAWASAGLKVIPLTVDGGQSLSLSAGGRNGYVWVGILVGTQSTTNVQLLRAGNFGEGGNFGLTAAPYRFGSGAGGLTALPASFNPTTLTANQGTFVAGLS